MGSGSLLVKTARLTKMTKLTPTQLEYWQKYLSTLPADQHPVNPFVTASFAGTREITDELLHLYLIGKKYAGSSIVEDFLSAGDPLPQEGNYWIFLNSKEVPSCILRTEKTVTHKFYDVPVEIAIAEGEGDLSLDYWRKVHSELYLPYLQSWGVQMLENATVITEFFKIVYR